MWKKIQRNQGKLIGPKFKDYLKLNFDMVKSEYIKDAFFGLVLLFYVRKYGLFDGDWIFIVVIATLVMLHYINVFRIIGFKSLYQKDAYLYQSFPVSAFETILAKTLVSSGAIVWLPLIVLLGCGTSLLIIPIVIAAVLCMSGEMLTAFEFGNRFRDARRARPSMIAAGVGIAGWLLVWCCLIYSLIRIGWNVNTKLLFILLVSSCGAIGRLIQNSIGIRKYYSL